MPEQKYEGSEWKKISLIKRALENYFHSATCGTFLPLQRSMIYYFGSISDITSSAGIAALDFLAGVKRTGPVHQLLIHEATVSQMKWPPF